LSFRAIGRKAQLEFAVAAAELVRRQPECGEIVQETGIEDSGLAIKAIAREPISSFF